MRRLLLVALLIAAPARADELDATIARALAAFEAPGAAVAVVKDGQVVLARGYGVRRLGGGAPVGPDTLFAIASNTKAFTAAALAILVDEGKLSWDDAVARRLPAFQLHDALATRELIVRDLVSHRSGLGLGAGDLLWFPPTDLARAEIVRRVRGIRPAASLRERYAYQNLMFVVAGELIPAVAGRTWEDFVAERIFRPLGMRRTTTRAKALSGPGDVAAPHARIAGKPVVIEPQPCENVGPAASINSTAADMSRWMLAQLAGGKPLFSEAQSREMWAPHIMQRPDKPPPIPRLEARFAGYGLGWALRDYRGRKLVTHGGSLPGYTSRVTLVPEERLGIVVLTNAESAAVAAISWTLLDRWLGADAFDWIAAYRKLEREEAGEVAEAEREHAEKRRHGTRPSLPLAAYAGSYEDDWYGKLEIREAGGKLVLRFAHSPALAGELAHWHLDTFRTVWREPWVADAFVTFGIDRHGTVATIALEAVSPHADFSFDYHDLRFRRVAPR
jgi:CubicO group peptidase (beta-lactamase class C family)